MQCTHSPLAGTCARWPQSTYSAELVHSRSGGGVHVPYISMHAVFPGVRWISRVRGGCFLPLAFGVSPSFGGAGSFGASAAVAGASPPGVSAVAPSLGGAGGAGATGAAVGTAGASGCTGAAGSGAARLQLTAARQTK